MGYTEREFEQVLKGGFSDARSDYRCADQDRLTWLVEHRHDPIQISIRIHQGKPRQLGILQLPVLHVTFAIGNGTASSQSAFFDKFFKYFHKGGG